MSDIPVSLNTSTSQRIEHARCSIERPKFRNYESFSERIKTYEKWLKNQVTDPSVLAAAGFFFTGTEDIVKCFYCGGELKNWTIDDNPWIKHKRFFPLCAFLKPTNTQDISPKRDEYKAQACKQLQNLSRASQTCIEKPVGRQPRYPEYADFTKRMMSYAHWVHGKPDPTSLSKAGFFFTDKSDLVRCYQCGIGLKDFSVDDDPLVEHVRHSGYCSFLIETLEPTRLTVIKSELENTDPDYHRRMQWERRECTSCGEAEIHDTDHPDLPHPNLIDKNSKDILPPETVSFAMKYLQERELRRENEIMKNTLACKICLDCDVRVVFLPCGHLVACERCAERLQNCAICRKNILKKFKVHFYP